MIRHPSFRRLCRYVDDESPDPQRRRLTDHLARCPRCRRTVTFLRDLGAAARDLELPEVAEDSFAEILGRRAAGTRVILPSSGLVSRDHGRAFRVAAAVLAVTLLGAGLLFRTPELEAERSELHFAPAHPRAGQEVKVQYRATSKLADQKELTLRARLFASQGQLIPHVERVATLARAGDRTFKGSFILRDSVSYAVFAVEDSSGGRVDHDPLGWDLLVHGTNDQPTATALDFKIGYLQTLDTQRALAAAREMAALYPSNPRSGFWLYSLESSQASEAAADSLSSVHRERLRVVTEALEARGGITADEMANVAFYAIALKDTAVLHRWRGRLIQRFPNYPASVQQRVFKILDSSHGDRARSTLELERLWAEVGPISPQLPFSAFMGAQLAGDVEGMDRWGERLVSADPDMSAMVAAAYLRNPALRLEGMDRARAQIRKVSEIKDELRPLDFTVEDQRRSLQRAKGFFLGELGKALVEVGSTSAAMDTMERAIETGWDVDLFRRIAEVKFSVGDTIGATPLLARIAADPSSSSAFEDSVQNRLGKHFDRLKWIDLKEAAHETLVAYISKQSLNQPIRGSIHLANARGERVVWSARKGKIGFVAFWSRHCAPSLMQLGQLERITARLQADGIQVTTITDEAPSPELAKFLAEKKYDFPVSYDVDREASRAFDSKGTPSYFVTDGAGRIRFASHSMNDVIRQVAVLKEEVGD